ncbi:16S rRNA (cytosine(1402)-N(4))-methyltransferase [Candidatus Jorgensenbacteria bacterium CG23_combo_of_CG06-09_8_20_14_all_54_14]|uniref:Ribosomal RNA small subunit methyltransferase H n=2 Tax=Candidatus Joergenseniibacteriota TaxID=1752739 RepID=A0A2G9ZC56_9BACT|nr:MAG: 16S rRNA (cytosine(1402)-N(4))-methyltransferase [Candidatus Jorgensenbacteria bacterium CG23_combo_of_CG06-09_8_20_14_all_54_14]
MPHIPVLLQEVIGILDPRPGGFVIDGTLGGGGHARELAKCVGQSGTLLGVDWDADAVRRAKETLGAPEIKRLVIVQGNYAELPAVLAKEKLQKADGLLLDLGLSSDQLAGSGRGFSFEGDEPLDMRYDTKSGNPSAAELLNRLRADELADIFSSYGEERNARRIAKAIVEARRKEKFLRVSQLASVIESAVPRHGKTHPATKVFMALRIFVNRELENLETILEKLPAVVRRGGKVAIITFHSLEDRIVKHRFQELAKTGRATLLTKKPITPTREEIFKNPRSRSAKLRAIVMQ